MSGRYKVRTTRHAEQSVLEIILYIAEELYAPGTAERIRCLLLDNINSLNFMPARIPLTPEEPWRSLGVHRLVVEDYYVYFWIDEIHQRVQVIDVSNIRMDQEIRLQTMTWE